MRASAAAGTVAEALVSARDGMAAAGVESPALDAELLLAEATGRTRAALVARPEDGVDAAAGRRFGAMVRRRVQREPLAYITGRRGFRRIELEVDRRVLIPRPETELLVELALELEPRTVLDIGTGSGAIALAVADELQATTVTATDVSGDALDVARANATRLGLARRVRFEQGTLPEAGGEFDLVLANLPYVADGEWPALQPEITRFEPRGALLAGADGLDAIRAVAPRLGPGEGAELRAAAVGFEIGDGQGSEAAALVAAAGFEEVEVRRDLAGHERCVFGRAGR